LENIFVAGKSLNPEERSRIWVISFASLLIPYLFIGLLHYNTNQLVDTIISLFLFIAFFNSKQNSYWMALFFLLISPFGGIFSGDHPFVAIPVWERGIYFSEVFAVVALIKALQMPRVLSFKYFKISGIFLLANLVLSIPTSFVFGVSAYSFLYVLRNSIHVLYLFAFPLLLSTQEEWDQFFHYLFIIVIILFVNTILEQVLHYRLAFLLGAGSINSGFGHTLYKGDEVLRFSNSAGIALIAFVAALYQIVGKRQRFPRVLLFCVVYMIYFLTLLSATRGWILSLSTVLFFTVFFNARKMLSVGSVFFFILILITVVLLISNNDSLKAQYDNMLYRMSTLELLAEGDVTAGNTLSRLTSHADWVREGIALSPMFGVGFSEVFIEHIDPHTGNLNYILQGGFFGLACWILTGITFLLTLIHKVLSLPKDNPYRPSLNILIIFFIGLLIIHSSSVMLFFYFTHGDLAFAIYTFFAFCLFTMNIADRYTAYMNSSRT